LELLRKAYMRILEKDEWKDRFKVMSNLMMSLYDASKPEIFERGWYNDKFAPISYLNGLFLNQIDDEKLQRAKLRMANTLDQSVSSDKVSDDANCVIHEGKVIDLSKLDVDSIRKEIHITPYKALEIEDLRLFI
jgi:type I restriction enzyme R subunit